MSREGVIALSAERTEYLRLYRSLGSDEWTAASGCEGWRVQDVLAHLSSLLHPTPSLLAALTRTNDVERLNDRLVDERRSWSPERQLDEYETWSRRGLTVYGVLQRRPLAAVPVRIGDLGTHPASRLVDATTFDHYTHLRFDVVAPHGPIDRPPPPADPLRLRPVLDWIMALVPICSDPALGDLDAWVELRLVGPGGGRWRVGPGNGGRATVIRTGEADDVAGRDTVAATISGGTPDVPGWATHRTAWRDVDVELSGDVALAEHVADAIHVF